MSIYDNIKNIIERDDEITLFDAGPDGYYAYLRSGARIDIKHAFNFQPAIDDFDDYFSFMFVESLQGFFLFRQRIVENKPRPWRVCFEIIPREQHCFFSEAWSLACRLRFNNEHPRETDSP